MMAASISHTVDVEKKLKDITPNRLNNEGSTKGEKPCIKFSEAVKVIYGPYIKNKVVMQHIGKLMSQANGSEDVIPGLNDPCVKKMLAAAKIQEENFEDGNNFILILCGFFLKGIESLKTSGISCTDIHTGYLKALIEALRVLDKLKVNLKEINVEDRNRHQTGIEIPENSKIEKKQDRLLYCEMDSTEKIKINRKNELLIKRKKGKKYYNTKVTFDWKDSSGTSSDKPSCDGFFEVDDMILLLEYRLSFFSNRKMKIGSGPVNIVLYSSDINCSSVYEENDCILHSVLTKMSFINWYICANIYDFHANVIVAVGQIDKLAVSEINREGFLVVTLENHFELQRLQKAVGGNVIPDFTIYLKKKDIGHASSVKIEELTDGIVIAIFEIKENDLDTKTVVVRDITYPDVKPVNSNSYKKSDIITPGAGVAEFLIGKKVKEYADNFTNTQNLVVKSFSEAMEEFSAILKTTAFSTPEMVDDRCLRDFFADFDIEDQSFIIQALKNGIMDSFEEKCEAIQMALNCAFDILDINNP